MQRAKNKISFLSKTGDLVALMYLDWMCTFEYKPTGYFFHRLFADSFKINISLHSVFVKYCKIYG
jgi:hypothetical protein